MRWKASIAAPLGVFAFLSGVAIWFPSPWDFVGARYVFVHALAGVLGLALVFLGEKRHRAIRIIGILLTGITAFSFALTESIASFRQWVVAAHVAGGLIVTWALFVALSGKKVQGVIIGACMVVFVAGLLAAMPARRPEIAVGFAPFAPADVRSATGGVLDIDLMNDSEICAQCHPSIAKEWTESMHGMADIEDPFYMPAHDLMDKVYGGVEPGRYCSACHNPGLVMSGRMVTPTNSSGFERLRDGIQVDKKYREEGISCLGCHAQIGNDLRGNGSYLLTHPQEAWFGLKGNALLRVAESAAIRIRSDWHAKVMRPARLDQPEFCASCHTQTVDERLNGFGFVKIRSEFEDWFAGYTGGKHTSEGAPACINCHMPLIEGADPANRQGKHRSHRFVAGHTALPHVYGYTEQVERTAKFLRGENDPPEISDRWPAGPLVTIAGYASQATYGTRLVIALTNKKVGHSFPAGTITFADCWVEVVVKDRDGKTIFEDGVLDPEGKHNASFKLFATLLDKNGHRLTMAQTFQAVGMGENRTIPPGYTENQYYRIGAAKGFPWSVTAKLNYRKISPRFQKFALGDQPLKLPIVTMSETTFAVDAPVKTVLQ